MVRIKRKLKFCRKIRLGHILCILIAGICLYYTVRYFPTALPRLMRAVKDFGTSVAYFFTVPYGIEGITPTVTELPSVGDIGFIPVPQEWENAKVKFVAFWKMFINGDLFKGFWSDVALFLPLLLPLVTVLGVLVFVCVMVFKLSVGGRNTDYAKESPALKRWKKFSGYTLAPLKTVCSDIKAFFTENSFWLKFFIGIWCLNFNIFAVAVDFFAWYFYFAASFDVGTLWLQVYKVCLDLWGMICFVPSAVWVIIILWQLNKKRFAKAKRRLRMMEADNCDFITSQPISQMIVGSQGSGKTTEGTDTVLSVQNIFRDKAFEILLNNDLKFPNFPWINFENDLRLAIENHFVFNLYSAREWVATAAERFEAFPSVFTCFGYDYERYPLTYNDGLNERNLFEVLDSYARAYFIYIVQSSLIFSNYPVRTDNILMDEGNLPLWNTDFLGRDPKYREAYSRYSHILDFDYIRLGLTVLEDPKHNNAFEFGIIDITEIGKERGNNLELKDVKKGTEETNQKNDLFNAWMKMCRHSATVDNFPFIKVFTDEQRPESWGADARDLADILHIISSGDMKLALPFYTIEEMLSDWAFHRFLRLYEDFRFRRGDNTLLVHILKSITARLWRRNLRIYNLYGYSVLKIEKERGTMDGKIENKKCFLMNAKIYANRFSTDCFSDYFNDLAGRSHMGLNDYPEYATEKASVDELRAQNSYFIRALYKDDGA